MSTFGCELIPGDPSHRLLRFDPRAARLTPTRAVKHKELHAHTVRFPECMMSRLIPFRRQHLDRVCWSFAHIDIPDHRELDTDLGHVLQIFRNTLLTDIAIQPVPVAPWLGGVLRVCKILFQVRRDCACTKRSHKSGGNHA